MSLVLAYIRSLSLPSFVIVVLVVIARSCSRRRCREFDERFTMCSSLALPILMLWAASVIISIGKRLTLADEYGWIDQLMWWVLLLLCHEALIYGDVLDVMQARLGALSPLLWLKSCLPKTIRWDICWWPYD